MTIDIFSISWHYAFADLLDRCLVDRLIPCHIYFGHSTQFSKCKNDSRQNPAATAKDRTKKTSERGIAELGFNAPFKGKAYCYCRQFLISQTLLCFFPMMDLKPNSVSFQSGCTCLSLIPSLDAICSSSHPAFPRYHR